MKKQCRKCQEWKPETEYWRGISYADGLQPHCKPCSRAYQRERYKKEQARMEAIYAEIRKAAGRS
jgi:hypothetical protein